MKIIIGLGNPEAKYDKTRHNIGFEVIDAYAHKIDVKVKKLKCQALIYKGKGFILAKPQTYMNNSGDSVQSLMSYFGAEENDILVIHDDMDHKTGTVAMKMTGSGGGQNGVKDIIQKLGTKDFPRIKVGIGRGKSSVNHVLGKFSKVETGHLKEVAPKILDAIEDFINGDTNKSMKNLNTNDA